MADRSVTVVVSGSPPAYEFSDIRACDREGTKSCAVPRSEIAQPVSEVETALKVLAEAHDNLLILPIFETLCPVTCSATTWMRSSSCLSRGTVTQETCHPSRDGVFTMRDSDHLNAYGAILLKNIQNFIGE